MVDREVVKGQSPGFLDFIRQGTLSASVISCHDWQRKCHDRIVQDVMPIAYTGLAHQ
jgi:hypothetical protein